MIIHLSPQLNDTEQPTLSVQGDTLTVNGTDFDFSPLLQDQVLPADAIDSDWITGSVTRDSNGEINVTVLLPHGSRAPVATRFPQPITIQSGAVELPIYDEPEEEPADVD